MKSILTGLLLCIFSIFCFSTDIQYVKINFSAGARDQSGVIHSICQDYLGYLWIGQSNGLYRLDGYDYKKILTRSESELGISNSNISCILQDSDSLIWIGTKGGGLNLYNRKTDSYTLFTSDSENPKQRLFNDIASIYEDPFHVLWIGTDGGGLYRLDKMSFSFEQVLDSEHLDESATEKVLSIFRSSPDEMYIGTWQNGLKRINLKNGKWDKKLSGLESFPLNSRRNIWSIAELNSNELILGTFGEGALIFNKITNAIKPVEGSKSTHVFAIKKDSDGALYLGSDLGLEKVINGIGEIIGSKDEIRTLTFDHEGNLWIGQQQNLWVLKNTSLFFHSLKIHSGFSVSSVYVDHHSVIWMAGFGKLMRLEPNGSQSSDFRLSDKISINMISDWDENKLVLATNEGVLFFDKAKGKLTEASNQLTDFKNFIKRNALSCSQTTDNACWISTLGMLYYKNNHQEKFITEKLLPGFSMSHYASFLATDTDSSLWIGTFGGGLNHVNAEFNRVETFKQNFFSKNGISNNFIECIVWDKQHRLWIGTHDGLNLLINPKTSEFKVFTIKDGLPNNEVNSMVADLDGNLWLGTANGLCRLNVEKMEFRSFGIEDGLSSAQFLKHAAFLQPNGQIIMGTSAGAVQFNPMEMTNESVDLKVVLQSFQLFNKDVLPGNNSMIENSLLYTNIIRLNYKQNYFGVNFTSLPIFGKENISYSHLLVGFDRDWQTSKSNSVSYTNVPPGSYLLKIKAISGSDVSKVCTLQIVIVPPWWQSKLAYWLYILLAILGICLAIYFVVNRERRKGLVRLQNYKVRKEQEMSDLKFAFFSQVANELKNPLTLIVNPLNELQNSGNINHSEFEKPLKVMQSGAFQMKQILDHLVEFKKIGTGEHQPNLSIGDLSDLLNRNCKKYEACAKIGNHGFHSNIRPTSFVARFDAGLIDKIQANTLDFFFNRMLENNEIDFSSVVFDDSGQQMLLVTICDNSGELNPMQLQLLLEPFSGGKSVEAIGFGLAITSELVKLCDGKIKVENHRGGLKIEIQIPIYVDLEKNKLLVEEQLNESDQQLVLLVINHLELRAFFSETFSRVYQVLCCGTAEEANSILQKNVPEFIVCDYELNGMNGLQFYQQLIAKNKTENIPFVLLTIDDAPSIKLAALQAGIHSVLGKPFNMDELQAIVRNYFASKKNIKGQLTSDSNSIHLLDVEITDPQKELLDRLLAYMEKNYLDSNLSVEKLCAELEMSRPQLYRKIQTLTGLSVQEFIKSFRLKKAAAFLRSGDHRISDVAYLVGFSDPQHFSKSFKNQFGKSPSQYISENIA